MNRPVKDAAFFMRMYGGPMQLPLPTTEECRKIKAAYRALQPKIECAWDQFEARVAAHLAKENP